MTGPMSLPNTDIADAEQFPNLEQLWTNTNSINPRCVVCNGTFEHRALVRTFQPRAKQPGTPRVRHSWKITGQKWDYLFFDRHQDCCPERTFIAVSHVWEPFVSFAHHQGRSCPEILKAKAKKHIFDSLERITDGLSAHMDQDMEVWYDYVSVPQWEAHLKRRILMIIPDIFSEAIFTLVDVHDVRPEAIRLLRSGKNSAERISGITQICNARWWSRVWTVMEFIRSRRLEVMLEDGSIVEDGEIAVGSMEHVWDEERKNFPTVHALERAAEMGKNKVPWNLGLLPVARARGKVDFGLAFSILSKRGCYSDRDFFHALLGIVDADLKDEEIKTDPAEAMLQIALSCMQTGDYSPVLMNPRWSNECSNVHRSITNDGYSDLATWGLGAGDGFPEHHHVSIVSPDESTIRMECIGKVTFASMMQWMSDSEQHCFLQNISFALDHTGPDTHLFIKTVAARLYNFDDNDLGDLLNDNDRCSKIQSIIEHMYNDTTRFAAPEVRNPALGHTPHINFARQLIKLLGMNRILPRTHKTNTPLGYLSEHGGTLHGAKPHSLIAARCPGCHENFVYRACLHRPPTQTHGSMAYRISGVRYDGARTDGAGILVKDGVIVGRLLWASPACDCKVVDTVSVKLRNFLPRRIPRDE